MTVSNPTTTPEYAALLRDVEQARADFVEELHGRTIEHARSNQPRTWQAAAWLLERTEPELYGRRDTTVVERESSPVVNRARLVFMDDEARDLSRKLLRRVAAIEPRRNGDIPAREVEALTTRPGHRLARRLARS